MTKKALSVRHEFALAIVLLAMGAWTLGCGGGGAGSVAPPPPPPPSITVSVTPTTGTVLLGETLTFAATVSNSTDTAVMWSVNGIAGGSAQAGTISADGVYTPPTDLPSGGTVQVTATSHADSSKSGAASVSISSDVSISLSPNAASVEPGAKQTMQATIHSQGLPDPGIRWSAAGPSCPNSCGTVDANGVYTAPQILPTFTAVNLTATSVADPSKQSAASLTITSHFTLQLTAPPDLSAGTSSSLVAVFAPVAGSNPSPILAWSLSGNGCSGSGCGSLSVTTTQSAGGVPLANTAVYTAPAAAPSPDALQVVALSHDDPTQSGCASVAILNGANITTLHPASVYAGGTNGFTVQANGGGFVASSPGPGSTLVVGGTARVSSCDSANSCSAPLNSADVSQPGSLSISVRNPDSTTSNTVQFVIVAPGGGNDVITLSSAAPAVTGKDITVVEPTTAGIDTADDNVDLDVAAIGLFSTSNNRCSLGGDPIPLARPSSGTNAADICLFSQSGFDTSMTYMISGPGDIAEAAGLGIIHLTLQIPATAAPGARTLFIQNANLDKTAASGVLQIQ